MSAYLLRRIWQMIPTMLGVILLVFSCSTGLAAIRPIYWPEKFPPEQIANIRRQLGVDQPYYIQLWIFISKSASGFR
jgi:peptide/nickel transport system permease protein